RSSPVRRSSALCRGADEAHRFGLSGLRPRVDQDQCFIERPGLLVDVAGAQAKIDAGLVAFDSKTAGTGHDRGKRLGAAHAAEAAGENPFALEVASVMLAARLDKRFVGP